VTVPVTMAMPPATIGIISARVTIDVIRCTAVS
jgi:hypothetical protein